MLLIAVGLTPGDFGLLIGLNGVLVLLLELPTTGMVSKRRPEYVLAIGNLFTGIGLALTGFATNMVLLSVMTTKPFWSLTSNVTDIGPGAVTFATASPCTSTGAPGPSVAVSVYAPEVPSAESETH